MSRAPAIIERDLPVRGLRIHWAECGSGDPAFLLLHGLGSSITKWLDVMPLLARAGRVVALDMPGFGRSDAPRGASYSPAWLAGGVRAFMDDVGLGRPVVVGSSLGGTVALYLAAAWPERARGLVLAAPALPRPPGARTDPRVALKFGAMLTPGIGEAIFSAYVRGRSAERRADESLALNCARPDRVAPSTRERLVEDEARLRARPELRRARTAAQRRLLLLMTSRRGDLGRLVRGVRVPTLFLWGSEDRFVPVRTGRHWAPQCPGAELVVLEAAGHNPQIELPEVFANAVLAFGRKVARDAVARA